MRSAVELCGWIGGVGERRREERVVGGVGEGGGVECGGEGEWEGVEGGAGDEPVDEEGAEGAAREDREVWLHEAEVES